MNEEAPDQGIAPILISFALHALILGVIFYLMSLEPEVGSNSKPIEVQFVDNKNKKPIRVSKKHAATGTSSRQSEYTGHEHEVSLSDLGMRLNTNRVTEPEAPRENVESEATSDNTGDSWDIMNPDPKIARFNQYIYNTVQGWLDRDASLNTNPVHGTVKVRIWFDENGNYLETETVYDAADPNFQMIVARALRKSFAVPIPKPFLYIHRKFSIERMVVIRPY